MLDKILAGSLPPAAQPDVVTLDLEDSVRTEHKAQARAAVTRSVPCPPLLLLLWGRELTSSSSSSRRGILPRRALDVRCAPFARHLCAR